MSFRLWAATLVGVLAFFPSVSAHGEELNANVALRAAKMTERTLLFRNDSDRIPQLEYLRPDGTGVVWSAALGDRVVPVAWTASNGEDGKGALCLLFKGADIGMARDLRLCDGFDVVEAGIRDARDGDPYGLTEGARMKVALPQVVNNLAEIDQLLGQD